MTYRFRLTAHNRTPGFFPIQEGSVSVGMANGLTLNVAPRDADTLNEATRYHFEAGGFETENEALTAGERLRQTLHVLIALFGLTLQVPTADADSSSISAQLRADLRAKGVEVRNGRTGLSVFPEDGSLELVVAGSARVRPSDPTYLLTAIEAAWDVAVQFDEDSKRTLELLALSAADVSPKTQFLMTYLALEQLIPKGKRSEKAIAMLQALNATVAASDLGEAEKAAISGAIGHLHDEPYSVALRSFVSTITHPTEFGGIEVRQLIDRAIRVRNSIAHRAVAVPHDIHSVTSALRQFAVTTVWTKHQIPQLNVFRPADTITVDKFDHRLL